MSAKSNKIGVVQLTILTMVNMMGSGIIMLPTKISRNWDYFHRFLACNSRWFNSLSLCIRTMRYVQ